MALEKNNTPLPVEGAPCSCINSSKVLELLECQVCYSYMNPPIHQCQNGHTLCSKCKIKVHNKCPTCREEFGNIRCLALEKLAESLLLPCKYNSSGCSDRFPHSAKPNHELQCNFKPYNCPYDNFRCSVTGDIPFLVSHLQFVHEADMYEKCTFGKLYLIADPRPIENTTWRPAVIHCLGRFFCLHFEACKLGSIAPVYMAFIRFMGDENEAQNYRYRLEVGNDTTKQIWEGVPRSIRESHQKVRDSNCGLIIPQNMALFYSEGGGKVLNLRVKGQISRFTGVHNA